MKIKSFIRKCPKCGKDIIYKHNQHKLRADTHNTRCFVCRKPSMIESARKVGKMLRGRKLSVEMIKKMSLARTGKPLSEYHKYRMSQCRIGKPHPIKRCNWKMSDAEREKRSERERKRANINGFINIDKGAPEWFEYLNSLGWQFKQNVPCIGYWLDGYDDNRHVVIEYDTDRHRFPKQQIKDIVRQNRIITHFINIGNPLKHFARVTDFTTTGQFGIEIVYRS